MAADTMGEAAPVHSEIRAPATVVTRLQLTGFRNYKTLSLSLQPRHVVLTGPNGAGKTNLIEAISLLSPGRGLRRATAEDLINRAAENSLSQGYAVFAALETPEDTFDVGTGVDGADAEGRGRKVRINGTAARAADELLDLCRVIWLTPAMDGLFIGAASDRRRFIDRMVLAIDPAHGRRANDFERALRQRNRLLEDARSSVSNNAWLDGIETELARLAAGMSAARSELVALLAAIVETQTNDSASFPTGQLALRGELETMLADTGDTSAAATETIYARTLRDMRHRDQAAKRTLIGPHRSDLDVRHVQKDIEAALCSTGEQKALLIGLVLSHGALTRQVSGHAPIMLFDEIAAHLDETRRAALFARIDAIGGQAFMTGTDRNLFDALGARGQRLRVDAGTVARDD